jgi:hypothetical protein
MSFRTESLKFWNINYYLTYLSYRMLEFCATFELMKKRRTIYLFIPILLIVVFFSRVEVHSVSDIHFSRLELSSGSNSENSLYSDVDPADEDQMVQLFINGLTEQPKDQLFYVNFQPHIDDLFRSVWQPPKII